MPTSTDCKCNSGFTCGGKCGLGCIECINKHYFHNCGHKFECWQDFEDGFGGEQVCSVCGLGAMSHSMLVGP